MKHSILIVLTIAVFFLTSCTKKSTHSESTSLLGTWQLASMRSSWTNHVVSGADLDFQETIILYEDSSFVKTRIDKENTFIAKGSFKYTTRQYTTNSTTENFVHLFYTEGNQLKSSCYSNFEEIQVIESGAMRLVGTWGNCDGPILKYHKK